MAKKIAVVNDLSGFGKCSLTAAIPVISVMGAQPCPLPTAVLSAQTGYDEYYMDDYTDRMDAFTDSWKKLGVSFDGIYTGFLASEGQIAHVERFLDTFYREDAFLLIDPVMGDNGKAYDMFSPGFLEKMKGLIPRAQVITPNLTELCLLTGRKFQEVAFLEERSQTELVEQMAREILRQGVETVVVTGIHLGSGSKNPRIGNLVVTAALCQMLDFPHIGGSFSGTGDLFASVIAGGLARGEDMVSVCRLAGDFIENAMKDSRRAQVSPNAGTEFEGSLGMLLSGKGNRSGGRDR